MRRQCHIFVVAVSFFSLCGAGVLFADEMPQEDASSGTVSVYRLSLDEVSRLALENNFDVQLAQYDAWIARTRKKEAVSVYDTVINAEVSYRKDKKKRATTILGTDIEDSEYNAGITKKLPTGTTLGVNFTNNRNETNSAFAVSPVQYESTLGGRVDQALGKNFFGIQDRGRVKIALLDIEQAEYTSLDKIEQQLADTQKAYWSLVLERENERIQAGMVERAGQLFKLNNEKLKDGLVELAETLASEANYQQQVNEFTIVRNRVQTKVNTLRLLLNITDDNVVIEPGEDWAMIQDDLRLDDTLKAAFENRFDYKRALSDVRSRDVQLVVEKNSIWPEINLTASLVRNGLDPDGFSDAIRQVSKEDNPDFFAGVTVSFSLENNEAEAGLQRAQLEKAKALLSIKLLERRITVGIIDQVRTCQVLQDVASRSRTIVDLEKRKMDEELKRFYRGRSNTDTVIRFQDDLLAAQLRSAQDMFDYYSARVDLRQKESSLLAKYWDAAEL